MRFYKLDMHLRDARILLQELREYYAENEELCAQMGQELKVQHRVRADAMREILFRGKRVDKDKWEYGVPAQDGLGQTVIVKGLNLHILTHIADCWYVEEDTVGQYTGLTDKNGKKIFEGDIVKHSIGTFIVKFSNGTFLSSLTEDNYLTFLCSIHNQSEVIGNIHDNPELLKGGESDA